MATATATLKKSIKPVEFIIKVLAKRVSETGTFSQLEVVSVTSALRNGGLKVSVPPQAGGAMYLRCDTLEGLEFIEGSTTGGVTLPKVKLF